MIHKTEAGERFTKSSHRASSPAPAPPSPALPRPGGARQCQDRASCPGGAGTGSVPPATSSPARSLAHGAPVLLLPLARGCNIAAVPASSGPRGSFPSLIDCTLVTPCPKEVLPFPRSFLPLPVFPCVAGAGAGGSSARPCQALQAPGSSLPLIEEAEKQAENISQPTEMIS